MMHPDELLSAHLDGELADHERRRVATHLVECERCRSELADLSRVRAAVRSLPMIELPSEVAELVGIPAPPTPIRRRPLAWVGAAAAAALMIFVGAAALTAPEPQQISPPELTAVYGAVSSNDPAFSVVKVAAVTQAATTGGAR